MKKILIAIIAMCVCYATADAIVSIPYTTNSYSINYHWGIINKVAASGCATYYTDGNRFVGYLSGHSIPWGGRIYTVRTSLTADFGQSESDESAPEIVISQQGVYSKPHVGQDGANVPYKDINGDGELDASPQTMEAVTIMSDMLSMFYYARTLDFENMRVGQNITLPIRRNGEDEKLYITYEGVTDYQTEGYSTRAYKIVFRYTYNGAPDSYPVTCLISIDSRVPVRFYASLLIGKVEMNYQP